MVYFVGAGTGAADLITVRGMRLLEQADVIIYAGSLVNPELLAYAKKECEIFNSATMTLSEVLAVMQQSQEAEKMLVRLHTGDPSIYGAIREAHEETGYPIETTCALLHVARSAYHKWASGKLSQRAAENERLADTIEKIHEESPDKGYRRLNDDLRHDHGIYVNDKRVLRICRVRDIRSTIKYSNRGCTRQA